MWDDGFRTTTLDALPVMKEVTELEMTLEDIELGGHEHFMLKEIFEQPAAMAELHAGRVNISEGRIHLGGLVNLARELVNTKRFIITACGTAWHASLVGEYLFEDLRASPPRSNTPPSSAIATRSSSRHASSSPSASPARRADTLAALREAQGQGALAIGVVNVVGSTIARETDAGIYLHVGPEIGVASTKAFIGQVLVLTLMARSTSAGGGIFPSRTSVPI